MKLHILSDLHIEFADFEPPATDADVVVLAGDIGVGMLGMEWASKHFRDTPVIYVPGNHEYYHHDLNLIDELRGEAPEHVHVMNDEQIMIGDVRILGSVLWTDFSLFGEAEKFLAMQRAREVMADFSVIGNNNRAFTPEDSVKLHETSRTWLRSRLAEPFNGQTVVVTHHAPSSKSVARRFATDLLTPAFASSLETIVAAGDPVLWIHGHTHDSFDYEIYNTRVVCNPRGYPGEASASAFHPGLVVKV